MTLLLCVSSFGLSACINSSNFKDCPVSITSKLFINASDGDLYIEMTITNNGAVDIKEMVFAIFLDVRYQSNDTLRWNYRTNSVMNSVPLASSSTGVYSVKVASMDGDKEATLTGVESTIYVTWLQFDGKSDWGDKNLSNYDNMMKYGTQFSVASFVYN